ncbi:HAD-IIA family hydrolase [Gordonia soli]|uniref:GCN5-related N-acetyltransferase-like domain-containing protein n=1 Tax=Gordonia soli NBRC 108243 TaxID=1223545 RepID=M0QQN1_9ACTN|nr:HAD-IIA family hydrolase [Gordonia soli]GAC69752.1 hypothetical protein GS4_27_00300 [Gordonia soli NBRC 108243]
MSYRDRTDGQRRPRRGGGSDRRDEPFLPDDVAASDLDPEVRRDLLTLDKANAESVARHLVMVSRLLDEDPATALAHARAARARASRVGLVRETAGVAAYNAGEWQEAVSELRAARRITGNTALLPLIADSERGLGRPERAIEIARSEDGRRLTGDEATEMRIVEAGARMDLDEPQKAVVTLQHEDLNPGRVGTGAARLFYTYASALEAAGRRDDAITWFMNAASADVDDVTDAELRLVEMTSPDGALEDDGQTVSGADDVAPERLGDQSRPMAQSRPEEPARPVESTIDAGSSRIEGQAPGDPSPSAPVRPVATPASGAAPEAGEAPVRDASSPVAASNTTSSAPLVSGYDALLLDLDGTVFAGSRPIAGAAETLATVTVPQLFVTNNASRRPSEVAAHLTELGFSATADQVVTSAQSAARLLSEHLQPGSRALVVGTDGLAQEVREVGIAVTRSADDRPAAVIQGHSPDTGWAQLSEAVLAIRAGARWIACNVDATLPSERGLLVGNGSMVAAVAHATGATPEVAGKPAAPLLEDAIERSRADRPLVVGDRLDTDIEGAHAVGLHSLLVLTGVSTASDLLNAPTRQRPTYVVDDLTGLGADTEAVRVGPQPGWSFDISGTTVSVRSSADARPESLLPALAAAVWEAQSAEGTRWVVRADEPTIDTRLRGLGLASVR